MPATATRIHIPCLPVADIELPREVRGLYDLAYNLWWTWNPEATRLFSEVDPRAWARYRNPVELLINVEPQQWEPLLASESFVAAYGEVTRDFEAYLGGLDRTWFARRYGGYEGGPIAYFSMEYGVHASLAIYSGGLGVLSGDHAKSASDLGLPFIAVGLLYRHGYFRQAVDAEGWQQHSYPDHDPARLPLRPAADHTGRELKVAVPLPGREVAAKVWVAFVGRVPLLLLDTDVLDNDPADRPITHILYVRGREMRLAQEMILGVGGARALEALGIEPGVWHVNEGHSALVQLERLRRELGSAGVDAGEARRRIAATTVFTTHTPVAAGNEQYDAGLAGRYLEPWSRLLELPLEELLAFGDPGRGAAEPPFDLTALALGTSRSVNAVSRINATVTSRMWSHLAPARAAGEPPIFPITNGVHTATWVGREMRGLFARWLGPEWAELLLDEAAWRRVLEIPDQDLWAAHQAQKERLGRFTRTRSREQFARHGRSPEELRAVAELFDPDALTIGFARRFATYKRAGLVFSQPERLGELLASDERPVQILLAGKAHPADRPGQELIQEIFRLSQSPGGWWGRVFFLEDYDMQVGQMLVQGVDLWLNTPRRQLEASGTSGQKAALNGGLNFSILDGWWPEAFDGGNGWAIDPGAAGTAEADEDGEDEGEPEEDEADAEALYRTLEEEIVPTFYDRDESGLPRAWIGMMKRSIATITPRFSSARMVRDYTEQAYLP